MIKRKFIMEYEFTSTKANGDNYKRRLLIEAHNVKIAYRLASIEGFKAFGARFNDNCIDWGIVND